MLQKKGVLKTTIVLAKEQLALAKSSQEAEQHNRKLINSEKKLVITEQKTALSTEKLRQSQIKTSLSAEKLRVKTERLAKSQKKANSIFKTGITRAGGLATAFTGVATGVLVKGLFNIGSELETVTIKFETLLGSTTKAKKRLEEIEQFSQKTPFQFPDVAKASALLETFGGEVLATGKNLKLVGDASAISGQKIDELSVHFGRLSDGLKNNRAVGESLMRFSRAWLSFG